MFSFAGVNLADHSESIGIDIAGWVQSNIRPESLFPLAYRTWPGSLTGPVLDSTPDEPRGGTIGSLQWPVGASRFARGHFIVSSQQLDAIRSVVLRNGTLVAAPLVFSDLAGSITTNLWHLPAIPLSKA